MRKSSLSIVMIALVCGCVSNGNGINDDVNYLKEIPMTADFEKAVHSAVASQLRDPYSAMFGPSRAMARVRNGAKEIVICGSVNSKNGFGGYAGMQPYIGIYQQMTSQFNIVLMGDDALNAAHVRESCRLSHIPI